MKMHSKMKSLESAQRKLLLDLTPGVLYQGAMSKQTKEKPKPKPRPTPNPLGNQACCISIGR
jgi:hypothetical protein